MGGPGLVLHGTEEGDGFGAVGAENPLANGVGRKLDMAAAEDTGHFQVAGLQKHRLLTVWARNPLARISGGELDVSATGRTG